ncbi:BQ2448_5461 [Microbotryum intermedium]|uniref:BQ2448_5461 protein n=1 Tax=Microbotryum intermedium TaxID=269621 RepID=A0A238F112_9BASI|nr:BQ2448_5461 [Microbotryum intermedium]
MASTSRLNPAEVLLLDSALLKVSQTTQAPTETLRKIHKTTQRTYEYNLGPTSSFQKELNDLIKQVSSSSSSSTELPSPAQRQEILRRIDAMLSKMRGLKRKLSDLSLQSTRACQLTQARFDHLSSLPESMDSPTYPAWARRRLSYQIADYFLRADSSLKTTADVFAKEQGIEHLVDKELWDELGRATDELRRGKLDQVLAWVGENKVALRKSKCSLEFTIHLQAYIELCRSHKHKEAIAYAKKHLSPSAGADAAIAQGGAEIVELSRAMALLAYGPETTCRPYQDLYSPARWETLITLFRETFLALHSLPSTPLLHMSLQAGIASLKTPICCPLPSTDPKVTAMQDTSRRSKHCPICSSPLGKLAPEVPYSHHVNSTIVCGVTGKVVEGDGGEGGQLLALISPTTGEASVYSREGLAFVASQQPDHRLVEPRTGESYEFSDLKKVFIS